MTEPTICIGCGGESADPTLEGWSDTEYGLLCPPCTLAEQETDEVVDLTGQLMGLSLSEMLAKMTETATENEES